VETGPIYQGGGGVNILLKERAGGRLLKSAGLRLGARGAVRTGGSLDSPVRVAPLVDVSLFLRY